MSGGSLGYLYLRIIEAVEDIKDKVAEYSPEVMTEIKQGIEILKKASVYAKRIEWLFSGDDGEENFLARLKEDLEYLDKGKRDDCKKS